MEHAGYDPDLLLQDQVKVEIPLIPDALVLTGHPDGEDEDWIYECKTMRSFAYRKLAEHGLQVQFPQYLVQGAVYCRGRRKKGVKFLCLDKDASHIQEVTVSEETLQPYWEKAVANALKIANWVGKINLPGKDQDLPYWYCLPAYCAFETCRYHATNRRNSRPLEKINRRTL